MSDEQDWDHWLDELADKGVNLSAFEIDFVEDLQALRDRNGLLSEKQSEVLERIYAARTP